MLLLSEAEDELLLIEAEELLTKDIIVELLLLLLVLPLDNEDNVVDDLAFKSSNIDDDADVKLANVAGFSEKKASTD